MSGSKKHSRFIRKAFNAIETLEARQLLSTTVPGLTYALQFKAPAVILPGSKQTATLEIDNKGTSLIETTLPITVYVSDAPTLDADSSQQTILSIYPSLRLQAGKSKSQAIHFTMPASFVTGTCYILVSANQQVFSTSATYNPSAGYGTGTFGNAPATGNDASEYLNSGTWTATGQTNAFSVNIRNLSDGSVYGDVLASGNFGQLSIANLITQVASNGRFHIHGANVAATIYPPGSSSSGTDSGSNSGSSSTSASTTTEQVNISISGVIDSDNLTGSIHVASIKPITTTGTDGSSTGDQADSETTGSTSTYTRISGSGNFNVTPPAPSVTGNGTGTGTTAPAVVISMSQLPSTVSGNFTLTGSYPTPSYVGTITAMLTNSQGTPLSPFTAYTVNTGAGTWAVSIPITGVPDGTYTVAVTDTNTATTITLPGSGPITISTIGTNVHFDPTQLPLVTDTAQTLTGTYDATDADGKQITGITVHLTDLSGNQTSFAATLSNGIWSAPISMTGLADGAYTVTATATDSAGNTGTAGAPGNFTIDTLVNTLSSDVQIAGGPWMATPNTPYTLTGTYTDPDTQTGPDGNPDSITAIIINLTDSQGDAKSFPATLTTTPTGGNWSALINVGSLTAGTYTVTGTIYDSNGSAGNGFANSTFTVLGLSPAEMRGAYGLGQIGASPIAFNGIQGDGSGETIAIVDAYDDPNAQADLEVFDQQFGLPNPPSFEKVNEHGQASPLPSTDPAGPGGDDWEGEESLDIEWAHAMAPGANIVLIEADSAATASGATTPDLYIAAQTAATTPGVNVVSMSWGMGESLVTNETQYDSIFATPGITFVASTGDNGASSQQTDYPSIEYPAASPNVVAVGGTVLTTNGNTYSGETAWSGGGGGVSVYESQPSYQTGIVTQSSTQRTVPDVSMDAAPNTGVPIYDSFDSASDPWMNEPIGGTSLAAPMFAAIVAIADQGRASNGQGSLGSAQTLQQLYAAAGTSDFHDVTTGSNGYYSAGAGYDLATGLGSPVANLLIPKLAGVPISSASSAVVLSSSAKSISNHFSIALAASLNNSGVNTYTSDTCNSKFSSLPITDSVLTDNSAIL